MDDHKLRVFCTVAECRSFSKASEIIHLTQPAVSLQVQAIEEAYETKLFERTAGAVTLTPAGVRLYEHAKNILSLYAAAEKEIGEMTGLVKGNLSLGASSTIGNYLLPPVLVDFRKKYPKIKVNLLIANTRRILDHLEAGEIDMGLVEGEVHKHKLIREPLFPDELVLVMSPDHSWASRRNISVSELLKEPIIFREEGSGTRQMIEKHLAEHGITSNKLKTPLVLGSTEAIKQAVIHGVGLSILSAWAVRKEVKAGALKTMTFKDVVMTREFSLIRPKRAFPSHASSEFLEFLKIYPFDEKV
ncbi:MAG: selenium metabolism-associated LysR family transcriptional regulator [Nitrospirota bacterium]